MEEYVYDGYQSRDGWGPCCRVCGSAGMAYKPCHVCIAYAKADESAEKEGEKEKAQVP